MTLLDWIITVALVLIAGGAFTYLVIADDEDRNYYSTDLTGDVGAFAFWAGAVVLLIAGMVVLTHHSDEKNCRSVGQAMNREYQWGSWTGCLIQTDSGEYVPESLLRFNENGDLTTDD